MTSILQTPLQYFRGIGPKKAEALKSIGCITFQDLLLYIPTHYVDRRKLTPLSEATHGNVLTQIVVVREVIKKYPELAVPMKRRKHPYTCILCSDKTGEITVTYFSFYNKYLNSLFKVNTEIVISGRVEWYHNKLQMTHPDIVALVNEMSEVLILEPIYRATAELTSKNIATTCRSLLPLVPEIAEWIPKSILAKHMWPSWSRAIKILHSPELQHNISDIDNAKARLAFDEILAEQIMLRNIRKRALVQSKQIRQYSGQLFAQVQRNLPFTLTDDQKQAIYEITRDQQSSTRMLRLLQGDVGSGKTLVALAAMLNSVEIGLQAVLMTPTELLAKQHYTNIKKLIEDSGVAVTVAPLVSSLPAKIKHTVMKNIACGFSQLIIGTHALIQRHVNFAELGLIVIDEQHRFGVQQRVALLNKGYCDLLMLSATPIPRTLTMLHYGDLDISILRNKPINRRTIQTIIFPAEKEDDLLQRIAKAVQDNSKIYWVCPLIDESEVLDLNNVTRRYNKFRELFGDMVGLVHGKMPAKKLEAVMDNFSKSEGQLRILVATTVVEVGIDVVDANVIVIEHAERFGLAQLHQLRGRVGRGNQQSCCILLYHNPVSNLARKRLTAICRSNDGFWLAEQDLLLRGGSKVISKKQSGAPMFKLYDIAKHQHLLLEANALASNYANNHNKKKNHLLVDDEAIVQLLQIYTNTELYVSLPNESCLV